MHYPFPDDEIVVKRAAGGVILLGLACLFVFLIVGLFLGGCATAELPPAQPTTVVAPEGDAAKAALAAQQAELVAQKNEAAAQRAILSSIAASAGNVQSFNADQPAGKFTSAIGSESGLILTAAGQPSAADEAAAAQRRLAVVSGNLAAIQLAYSGANKAIQTLQAQVAATQTALDASRTALASAEDKAQVEQQQAAEKLQAQFSAKQKEIDTTRAAAAQAISKEAQKQRLLETGLFFGLSALLFLASCAVFFLRSAYALFGPRAALALLVASIGLAGMGIGIMQVQNFLDLHPYLFWFTLAGIGAAAGIAFGLTLANHHFGKPALFSPLTETVTPNINPPKI